MDKLRRTWSYARLLAVILFTMAAGAACYQQYIVRQKTEIKVVDKPHAGYLIQEVAKEDIKTSEFGNVLAAAEVSEYDQKEEKKEYQESEPFKILTTAYCEGEVTATGTRVRYGICAVKKEWLGLTAEVYACKPDGEMGELLGYWECLDTGFGGDADGDGVGSIQEGRCIDMYFPNLDECQEWMRRTGGKVYVRLLRLEG